jgi:nucleoside-diphosphate-sugar epimerase
VITLAPEQAVPAREFFAHYFRMLGRPGPRCAPTPVAVALAAAVSAASRAPTEVNPETMRYLARPGGYSVAKAARLLGWRAQVALDEGMARTERWLRAEHLLG